MDVLRIRKPRFTVIGIEGSTEDGDGFIQRLWGEANARFPEIQHLCARAEDGTFTGFWDAMTDFTRSFLPWEDFKRGLYLAGAACVEGAEPPEGWTKWVIPGFEYLRFDCAAFSFPDAIGSVREHGYAVAGAVQDYTDPRTGENYIYVPIRRLAENEDPGDCLKMRTGRDTP